MARPNIKVDPAKLKQLMRLKPRLKDTAAFFECSVSTIQRFIRKEFNLSFIEFREQNTAQLSLVPNLQISQPSGILLGDCLERLREMSDNSVDACVTDPPYGLAFMGKKWDYDVPSVDIWREVLRVLKPGGHLLSFGGTRTYHRMVVAIEDAGFEVRDQIQWLYASGFPKSHDVSKAIDKQAGAEREVVGINPNHRLGESLGKDPGVAMLGQPNTGTGALTAPATPDAKRWQGWGSALKPANEPIVLARKPLEKGLTIAENVLKYGTGALNIDAGRVGSRFPANLILDEAAAEMLDEQSGVSKSSDRPRNNKPRPNACMSYADLGHISHGHADSGGASRFFYVAKASKRERGAGNNHPTVKPIKLMEYLIKLITPPGGVVLDPFMGSGSTGVAARMLGFEFIGIELNAEYFEIAEKRIANQK